MFLSMLVSLYTSRIVLNTLGVEDFGIYNVVGGIVVMFSFLNGAMATATQRFLSFEIGRHDFSKLKKIFSVSVTIHILIALVIVLIAETFGLWFLNTKMNIPAERMEAAQWVYQFSVLSCAISVSQVPYNATIIAHEKMNVYAYVSIAEVSLKLIIVFLLVWIGIDKLKLYAILIFSVSLIITAFYYTYCKHKFKECHYSFYWDKSLFSSLINFSGWYLLGNLAWMTMGQGLNILLNIFFGPIINTAWGIAFQINAVINGFVSNIRMAINPQIVKSYAAGDVIYMHKLVFESAKYSFYLLLLLTLPFILETNTILHIWLKMVPDYAIIFCQLVLINSLIQCFDGSFGMVFQAIGKIKENQLLGGLTYLFVLPTSYVLLKNGNPPETIFYVQIIATIIVAFVIKLYLLIKIAGIPASYYYRSLILPVAKVTAVSIILPILFKENMAEGIVRLFTIGLTSSFSIIFTIYFIGIDTETKIRLKSIIRSRILMLKNRM